MLVSIPLWLEMRGWGDADKVRIQDILYDCHRFQVKRSTQQDQDHKFILSIFSSLIQFLTSESKWY